MNYSSVADPLVVTTTDCDHSSIIISIYDKNFNCERKVWILLIYLSVIDQRHWYSTLIHWGILKLRGHWTEKVEGFPELSTCAGKGCVGCWPHGPKYFVWILKKSFVCWILINSVQIMVKNREHVRNKYLDLGFFESSHFT